MTLRTGQDLIAGFPRFDTHLPRPAPLVPIDPVIEIAGPVAKSLRPASGRARCASPPRGVVAFAQAPSPDEGGEEERYRYLPAWSVRQVCGLLIPPVAFLGAHGNRRGCRP